MEGRDHMLACECPFFTKLFFINFRRFGEKTNRSHDKLERKSSNNERARQHDRNTAREMKDNVERGQRVKDRKKAECWA